MAENEKNIEDLKKGIKEGNIVLGMSMVLKQMKLGGLKSAYVSSNCKKQDRDFLKRYATIQNVEIVSLPQNSEDLGVMCKKPFAISAIGLRRV